MTFLKSAFALFSSKHRTRGPMTENLSLSAWRREVAAAPTRQVERVQFCSAKTSGTREKRQSSYHHDTHSHTFLRAFVAPTIQKTEEVVLIERVQPRKGIYHSVAPIPDTAPIGSEIVHNEPLDRACIIPQGAPINNIPKFEVERTLEFNYDMSVQELAIILEFVSKTTKSACARFGCADMTRSFAFTCLAALAPEIPPASKELTGSSRLPGVSAGTYEAMLEGDAKRFVDQYSSMPRGTQSAPTHQLIQLKRGNQLHSLIRTPSAFDM